jgi:clan AA aspartic protease (TIGR02281 family)
MKALLVSIVLGLDLAAPHPAHAADFNLTCNMTSVQNGSNVVYHFILSDSSTTAREASVWRDGSQLTPNRSIYDMPTWNVVVNHDNNTSTLWSTADKGWSLVSFIKPNPDVGRSAVFTPSGAVASNGECTLDAHAVPQAPPREPDVRPVTPRQDAVPLLVMKNTAYINVLLGGRSLIMMVDTGASSGSVPTSFADTLIAEGVATEGEQGRFKLADGSIKTARTIIVANVVIGGHTIHNVEFGVAPDDAGSLLGFNALSAVGAFKIDPVRGVLTFS